MHDEATPTQKILLATFCIGILLISIGSWFRGSAHAATQGATPGFWAYGAVQVAATATAVPLEPAGSRNAWGLTNLGPNPIYCGGNSSVTTATGWPVPANGGMLTVDVTFSGTTPFIYCISTALQVAPFNTRWMEVRC